MKRKKPNTQKSRKRKQQIADGAYDGRYKTKVVPKRRKIDETPSKTDILNDIRDV